MSEFPGGDYDEWKCAEPDDDGEREPAPTFGCACENALVVDITCDACIAYLRQRDAETEATPGAIPAREMDDVTTAHQCVFCGRAEHECKCELVRAIRGLLGGERP